MIKITLPQWEHIPAGGTAWNGYPGGYCTAPKEAGRYTLYEIVNPDNTHAGWEWERE